MTEPEPRSGHPALECTLSAAQLRETPHNARRNLECSPYHAVPHLILTAIKQNRLSYYHPHFMDGKPEAQVAEERRDGTELRTGGI